MKYILAAFVAASAAALSGTALGAAATTCSSADPKGVLASVGGDFELVPDPQDLTGNLIFVTNAADGSSSVKLARVNGTTGQVVSGSLTTIANNFLGQAAINGPEFVRKPSGALGVLYAGPEGVHAVFRGDVPAAWNDFRYNADGTQAGGSPTALPNNGAGAYPSFQLTGNNTYSFFKGPCTSHCAADLRSGAYTDLEPLLNSMGYTGAGAALSPRDGFAIFGACDAGNNCGLYEAQVDLAGGLVPDTFQQLASTSAAPNTIAAVRHPVTGTTVVYTNVAAQTIEVWEQAAAGGPLALVAEVPSVNGRHFTAKTDSGKAVLHYYATSVLKYGSYTLPVTASGTRLVAGTSKLISRQANGTELAWLPPANKWALFYREAGSFTRCWVTP